MPDVLMPRLSDSMEEGTILRWLKSAGEEIARGEELVEIETDKATMTYEADAGGVLTIVAAEGDTLPVGAPIARLGADGAAPAPGVEDGEEGTAELAEAPAPAAPAAAPEPPASPQPAPAGAATGVAASPSSGAAAPGARADGGRVKASPVARRLARERGIDLDAVQGSGPGGRIVRRDVETAAEPVAASSATPLPPAEAPPVAPAAGNGGAKGGTEVVELSRAQQVVARRMAESRATVPDFEVRTRIDATEVLALRSTLKGSGAETVPSVNDFVVKAIALALREFPRANGAYKDGRWELHQRVNVGIAVATDEGLVVPTIFDADVKPVGQIAREARALAGKVRDGKITPPDLSGGTFTVSNLGMFGITSFSAVIFPPQAGILAVGAAMETPVVREGEVVVRSIMEVSLACDHRILYGADGARVLARLRELLEAPMSLLVG